MIYVVQILYAYVFNHCPATGIQNSDDASLSIILVGRAILVKMIIPFEPHGIFVSNFVYLCVLTFWTVELFW